MPYDASGNFTLVNSFDTGTPPNNQFPPQVGATLNDIATSIAISNLFSQFSSATISGTFNSVIVGSPTGGYKGAGSVNAVSLYQNGTALGTAALLDVGTGANDVVQLNGSSQLPAVDGSLLTGLSGRLTAGTPLVLNPYAASATTTQAHGLGVVPVIIEAVFQCLTGNLNYSIGDLVRATGAVNNSILVDATNVVLITNSGTTVFPNKTTYGNAVITNTDWKLTITPYKIT